ncbi:2OG-Fe(II)oxygenase superfamily [Fusarium subglutinans]|uniref:2OG-Fe(II)oxygenase superfamily n=1 Tax=Gibberella subglutinans TaxID=42677 RepID=A0A8H5Q037_GIBSU|nr:2OG-Fe(II)oxygenase superfamily [Fusarium subglutinans]KAF5606330.1 2OG-Fe(II)oxygenase superfamily [Fusarium subglutinans]
MAALPIIDLSTISEAQLASELIRVGNDPGFFYVTGHGIVPAPVFELAREFFQVPRADKMRYRNGSGDLGYTGMREESLAGMGPGDIKESFYLCDPSQRALQELHPVLENGRDRLARFFTDTQALANRLLRAMEIGLKIPEGVLTEAHTGESCRIRLINYPATSTSADDNAADEIRAGEHTDYGSLTLLYREPSDQGGLQVQQNGSWIDVPCFDDTIVVNIGDALEFWTAGRLRSTVHRVAFPRTASENVARLSIPVFIQPDREVLLSPLKTSSSDAASSIVNDDIIRGFNEVLARKGYQSSEPVKSWEHLRSRIRATYKVT